MAAQTSTVCLLTDQAVHAVACATRGRRIEVLGKGQATCQPIDSLLVDHDAEALAHAVARAIRDAGAPRELVTLVIPLQWCFSEVLTGASKRMSNEALAFLWEERLPLAVEALTCSFSRRGGGDVLAVAIPTAPMTAVLAALQNEGIEVDRLLVDAIVAAGSMESGSTLILDARWARFASKGGQNGVLSPGVFGVHANKNLDAVLTQELQRRALTNGRAPGEWSVFDLTGGDDNLTRDSDWTEDATYYPLTESIERMARTAASTAAPIDLRTAALAAAGRWDQALGLAQQCMMCGIMVTAILIGGLYIHARTLEDQTAAVDAQRLQVYREVFDVEHLPLGAAMRLASERAQLEGLTRTNKASSQSEVGAAPAPLDVLRHWVANLPADVRIMLTDASLDAHHVTLRGKTAKHRDAERMVEALHAIPGVHPRPPRTTRIRKGGVEFSITATLNHEN